MKTLSLLEVRSAPPDFANRRLVLVDWDFTLILYQSRHFGWHDTETFSILIVCTSGDYTLICMPLIFEWLLHLIRIPIDVSSRVKKSHRMRRRDLVTLVVTITGYLYHRVSAQCTETLLLVTP